MTDIELNIVNAHGLDPGKVYIIEYDRTKLDSSTVQSILRYLNKQGVKGAMVRSHGGDAIRVIEPEKEPA